MTIRDVTYYIELKPITFCRYELTIGNKSMQLNFPQLLQLRYDIKHYTTSSLLSDIIENDNFVLLFVADKKHLVYLEIPQLLDLKDEINLFFNSFDLASF